MIKGINKSVVEVHDTGNPFIERAILFLDPELIGADHDIIDDAVRRYLNNISVPIYRSKRRQEVRFRRQKLISIIAGAGCILLAAALVILLIIKL